MELVRYRLARVSCSCLAELLRDGQAIGGIIESGLPAGAKVVAVRDDRFQDELQLLVEHESFDPVPVGEVYPDLIITVRSTPRSLAFAEPRDN